MRFFIASLIIFSFNLTSANFPSGCSTYIICKKPLEIKGKKIEDNKSDNQDKNGEEVCTHPTDKTKVLVKANWKNNKLHGSFWCAQDDGTPYVETHYKEGEVDGLYKLFDKNLNDWREVTPHKMGKRHGLSVKRGSNNNKIIQLYDNDEAKGFEWHIDKDQKVSNRLACRIGSRRVKDEDCPNLNYEKYDALFKKYEVDLKAKVRNEKNRVVENKDSKGKVRSTYKLIDGKTDGTVESYYREQGTLAIATTYKMGQKISEKEYFKDGNLQSESLFKNGLINSKKIYFQNKKMNEELYFDYSNKNFDLISYRLFYDNGVLAETGKRSDDNYGWSRYHDKIQKFSQEGELVGEYFYSFGKRVGKWKYLTNTHWVEEDYEKDILKERKIFDKSMKTLLVRRTVFMEDGSIKEDHKDASYKE